jgi:hypothetical protein
LLYQMAVDRYYIRDCVPAQPGIQHGEWAMLLERVVRLG